MFDRRHVKHGLAALPDRQPRDLGTRVLIYHRVGGCSRDELDVEMGDFRSQVDLLADHPVVPLDDAVNAIEAGDQASRVVLTFDDGFADAYTHAWPLLRERQLPFTVYLATAYIGGSMRWEGSTARAQDAPALSWPQLDEMVESGLCTVGNHTHSHVRPERLDDAEVDGCTDDVERRLGLTPRHFAYTWGLPVPRMEPALRHRFRSAATGRLGTNTGGVDLMRLERIPVRRTDPVEFFAAKLAGRLLPERAYAGAVAVAKAVGLRG